MKRLFVGNLPFNCTEEDLRRFFEEFGNVQDVRIITDRETGRSRGFGFVSMDDDAAETAMTRADGADFGGRPLRVNEAMEKRSDGGGGGGGGSWGGGGGDRY